MIPPRPETDRSSSREHAVSGALHVSDGQRPDQIALPGKLLRDAIDKFLPHPKRAQRLPSSQFSDMQEEYGELLGKKLGLKIKEAISQGETNLALPSTRLQLAAYWIIKVCFSEIITRAKFPVLTTMLLV